jgi:Uma2 family endonuclease
MVQLYGGNPTPPNSDELVSDDGEPMESARHRQQMVLLIESLEYEWRNRDDFYVGGNMALYFSETQVKKNDFRAPDVFVAMNTTRHERRGWVVWDEGQAPDVVIELLSESTEHVDRGDKMRIYARMLRVPEYFLFDPFSCVFEGYELDANKLSYVRKQPDEQGRLRCDRLGLLLAPVRGTLWSVEASWLRWHDAEGRVFQLGSEAAPDEAKRAAAQVERANAEAERANAAVERANAEAERANAEAERANAEAERANAEAERANRLRTELEQLKRR